MKSVYLEVPEGKTLEHPAALARLFSDESVLLDAVREIPQGDSVMAIDSIEHVWIKRDGVSICTTRYCDWYYRYAVRGHSGWLVFDFLEDARRTAKRLGRTEIWEMDIADSKPHKIVERLSDCDDKDKE